MKILSSLLSFRERGYSYFSTLLATKNSCIFAQSFLTPQFLEQEFPECRSIARTFPFSFCLFLSTAHSHLWQKIWEPSSVCCDILCTVKWQISCCCAISRLALPSCAVYMQSKGVGLQKGEGGMIEKKMGMTRLTTKHSLTELI